MKCDKCGNEYPSQYYFKVPNICNDCFEKMPEDEQKYYEQINQVPVQYKDTDYRIGFGRRLGAALIDSAILLIVMVIVLATASIGDDYIQMIKQVQAMQGNESMIEQYVANFFLKHQNTFLFTNLIVLVYYSLEVFIGASLGKLMLGIRIARADREVAPVSSLFMRFIFKYLNVIMSVLFILSFAEIINTIGLLFLLLVIIGFFFTLGEKRQAFHDMLSGTAVYHKSDIKSQES